jgi:hypothetical protein
VIGSENFQPIVTMSDELEIDEAINIPIAIQKDKLADALKKVAYYGFYMMKEFVCPMCPTNFS